MGISVEAFPKAFQSTPLLDLNKPPVFDDYSEAWELEKMITEKVSEAKFRGMDVFYVANNFRIFEEEDEDTRANTDRCLEIAFVYQEVRIVCSEGCRHSFVVWAFDDFFVNVHYRGKF